MFNVKTVIFCGTVVSGVGGGRDYIDAPSIRRQIEEKLGYTPHPGTMNIRLTAESAKKRQELSKDKDNILRPKVNSYPGVLFNAQIGHFQCAIIHPEDPNYPTDLIEVIAPVNLRKELGLSNGSVVTIKTEVP
jgi:riboflavin kinase